MVDAITHTGDCLEKLQELEPESVDLVYADPPFYSQEVHESVTRDGASVFRFRDIWSSEDAYLQFIHRRAVAFHRVLKPMGSLFFHCDKSASHLIRLVLDEVFGRHNFRSEIIWSYRRWSNAKKGLLSSHQNILFYSKSSMFKFNTLYQDYSPTTNVDQILQKRVRDSRNKVVYQRDESGQTLSNGPKKGVPLSDVWDIPYLNPKARERVGYPTQKPILLLQRIIELVTDEGDWVLDPFCGSGTAMVAAKLLRRNSIGIDISEEAVALSRTRLDSPTFSDSKLLQKGIDSYRQHDSQAKAYLFGLDYTPVQRNSGIDAILKGEAEDLPVLVRVQRQEESLAQAVASLRHAAQNKGNSRLVVVATHKDLLGYQEPPDVNIISATPMALLDLVSSQIETPTC